MNIVKTRFAWMALLASALGLSAGQAVAQPTSGWQKFENPAPVIGADGKRHQASCSGYPGTDPTFSFWAKRTQSKNVMVYFEGGGACWDDLTCTFPMSAALPSAVPQFFMPAVPAGTDPAQFDGAFKADNPANPMADWNVVYIPYCTADLHTGSATRTYSNVGHPAFPLPPQFTIEHRGFDNFMVVLDWMKKNFDNPAKVLVTGISAGGYGATANMPWLNRTWPRARTYLLADASQGVTTPAFDQGNPGRNAWNMQLAPWVFGNDPSLIPGPELMRRAAQGSRNVRTAQFTTDFDTVQIGFYGLMKTFYGPGGSCPNPVIDWTQQMRSTLLSYADDTRNFRHYVASGQYHTIMSSPQFYAESSAGVAFSDWTASLVQKPGAGAWKDASCPTCLAPLPCQ